MHVPGLRHSADTVSDLMYFGRMLDKIRLHAAGQLPADYNRGTGFDARLCRFLKVDYAKLVERALAGGSDAEVLEWCYVQGRRPTREDIEIFNAFLCKRGWRDEASDALRQMKEKYGLGNREDIQTFFDFHRADELPKA